MSGSQCAFASVFFSADGSTGWVTSVICSKRGQAPRSPARNQSRCSFTRAMCSLDMESKSFVLKKESSTRAFPALLLLHLVPRYPAARPFLSLVMLIIQLCADAEHKASGLQDPWVGGQMYS